MKKTLKIVLIIAVVCALAYLIYTEIQKRKIVAGFKVQMEAEGTHPSKIAHRTAFFETLSLAELQEFQKVVQDKSKNTDNHFFQSVGKKYQAYQKTHPIML